MTDGIGRMQATEHQIQKRTPPGTVQRFLAGAIEFVGDECLDWPFNKHASGYGKARWKGKHALVHRVVCEEVHGPKPGAGRYEAAHSCHNPSCVNPAHISWKTPQGNTEDKIERGTWSHGVSHGMTKLSVRSVRAIRELRGVMSQKTIAKLFEVGQSQVGRIQRGEHWGHIK